jgi:hypothetical protein
VLRKEERKAKEGRKEERIFLQSNIVLCSCAALVNTVVSLSLSLSLSLSPPPPFVLETKQNAKVTDEANMPTE